MKKSKSAKILAMQIKVLVGVAEEKSIDDSSSVAAFNLIQYLSDSADNENEPDNQAVGYLQRAMADLTAHQLSKLTSALTAKRGRPSRTGPDEENTKWERRLRAAVEQPSAETIHMVISALPRLSHKQRLKLADQLTVRPGRSLKTGFSQDNARWWKMMRAGAEVSRIMKQKKEMKKSSTGGPGPYEHAIELVSDKYALSETVAKDCYKQFSKWREWGVFQDDDPRLMGSGTDEEH